MNTDPLIDKITTQVKNKLLDRGLLQPSSPKYPWKNPGVAKSFQWKKPIPLTMEKIDPKKLAAYIDHTLLKPDANHTQLKKMCDEAKQFQFAGVCVNSANIRFVATELKGTSIKPVAVVGFPLGAASTEAKAFEAREAIAAGALEIDMVMNLGALKDKNYEQVVYDIAKVVEASASYPVKVILETGMLSYEEKIIACVLSKIAGAAFVKTSTGFGPGGATPLDVKLMKTIVGETMGVKASGGIRTYEDAIKMIEAGANRLGTSSGIIIVTQQGKAHGHY